MASPRLVFTGPDGSCFVRLLSQQPTFEKVQGWVHRKLRLAEGEGFDAAFACDLLDGAGEREVMLDDDEDLDALAHLVQHGFFATDTIHVAVRVVPAAPAPPPTTFNSTTDAIEDVVGIPSNEDFQRLLQMIAFPPSSPTDAGEAGPDQSGPASAWEQVIEQQPEAEAPSQEPPATEQPNEKVDIEKHDEENDEEEEDEVDDDDEDDDFIVVVESASAPAQLPSFAVSALAPVPQPAVVVVEAPPAPSAAEPSAVPLTAQTMNRSASSSLSPTAAVFNPSSTAIPSLTIEAASPLASSTSSASSAIAEPATSPPSVVALQPAPVANVGRPKTAGLAILARRLPSPVLATFPTDVQAAPPSIAALLNPSAVPAAAEGGQHSFRPSAPVNPGTPVVARQTGVAAVDAPSATQEANDFLASRSFQQELRWADDVDSPPRTRHVPGTSSPGHASPLAVTSEPVVVGGLSRKEAARNAYSHLSVDAAGGVSAFAEARQRQAEAAVDHIPAVADGRAAPDTAGAVAFEADRSEVDLEDLRQSHYRRQQSPPQNRGASSSSFASTATSTRRFVSSSSTATSHPSPTSSNAPSTPGDHEPTPATTGRFSSHQQPFTPPPAKPIFTGCDYGRSPSPEQAVVNLDFSGTTTMPEFGAAPADPKPNKRVRVRAGSNAKLDAPAPASLEAAPVPLRSITPTGVQYTSLRDLFPSLFVGKPAPGPIARPQPVKSWLAKELAPAYMREGKCFRCSAVGHVKAACPY